MNIISPRKTPAPQNLASKWRQQAEAEGQQAFESVVKPWPKKDELPDNEAIVAKGSGEVRKLIGREVEVVDAPWTTYAGLGAAVVGSGVIAYQAGKKALDWGAQAAKLLPGLSSTGNLVATGVAAAGIGVGLLGLARLGVTIGDLGSGHFHHAVDNYPDKLGVLGEMPDDFLAHHYYANSMDHTTTAYAASPTAELFGTGLALASGAMVAANALAPSTLGVAATLAAPVAVGVFGGGIFAQVSHAWTHRKEAPADDSKRVEGMAYQPKIAKTLQNLGIAQDPHDHRSHHQTPWTGNYCIVNGECNPVLDKTGYWRSYEKVIYNVTGALADAGLMEEAWEPKSWQNPAVERYALDPSYSREEFEADFAQGTKEFRKAIGYSQEREYAKAYLHNRYETHELEDETQHDWVAPGSE